MIEVEVNRVSGKFESKESMAEAIIEEVAGADPGSLSGPEHDGEWEVTGWEVSDISHLKDKDMVAAK